MWVCLSNPNPNLTIAPSLITQSPSLSLQLHINDDNDDDDDDNDDKDDNDDHNDHDDHDDNDE